MGVQAGAATGIFTVAVNTGPIDGQVLLDAGANVLFPSMQDFATIGRTYVKRSNKEIGRFYYLWKKNILSQ